GAARHDPGSVALVLWLGVGPTALAYAAYFAGLRSVPATSASVLALLEPLVATAGAAVLLAQRPGLPALAGGALLLTGIVVLRVAPTMAVGPRR
ncbi:MAG TPA: DMT family transporter, partial [Actinotalea sp.]|nr:DMT family transporter [Actinotalea sp.]